MPPPSHCMDVSRSVSSEALYCFTAASHLAAAHIKALCPSLYMHCSQRVSLYYCTAPMLGAPLSCFLPCLQLAKQGALNLKTIRHFIIDECDKVLENIGESNNFKCETRIVLVSLSLQLQLSRCSRQVCLAFLCHCSGSLRLQARNRLCCCADMRADVQDIFKQTPHDKQVMMFSATLSQEIRPICKKFMTDVCPFSAKACGLPAWRPLSMASLSPVPPPCGSPLILKRQTRAAGMPAKFPAQHCPPAMQSATNCRSAAAACRSCTGAART